MLQTPITPRKPYGIITLRTPLALLFISLGIVTTV
jgi:hypothetical protein